MGEMGEGGTTTKEEDVDVVVAEETPKKRLTKQLSSFKIIGEDVMRKRAKARYIILFFARKGFSDHSFNFGMKRPFAGERGRPRTAHHQQQRPVRTVPAVQRLGRCRRRRPLGF